MVAPLRIVELNKDVLRKFLELDNLVVDLLNGTGAAEGLEGTKERIHQLVKSRNLRRHLCFLDV